MKPGRSPLIRAGIVRAVGIPDEAREVQACFAERARDAMLADGWGLGPEGPATGDSIFLGSFQRGVAPEFDATVQLVLESGPTIGGMELRPAQSVVRTGRVAASVGGELGVRHVPTERLLAALQVPCEADTSLDMAEIFEAQGNELPFFTDDATADVAPPGSG